MEETHVPGGYFLLNKSQDQVKRTLYIGEMDDVTSRLSNHRQNKDWWKSSLYSLVKILI